MYKHNRKDTLLAGEKEEKRKSTVFHRTCAATKGYNLFLWLRLFNGAFAFTVSFSLSFVPVKIFPFRASRRFTRVAVWERTNQICIARSRDLTIFSFWKERESSEDGRRRPTTSDCRISIRRIDRHLFYRNVCVFLIFFPSLLGAFRLRLWRQN